jgi:hypothetical protein
MSVDMPYRKLRGSGVLLWPSVPTVSFNAYSMLQSLGVRYTGHNDHELEAALRPGAELRCSSQ